MRCSQSTQCKNLEHAGMKSCIVTHKAARISRICLPKFQFDFWTLLSMIVNDEGW